MKHLLSMSIIMMFVSHPALTYPGSPGADGCCIDQCYWQDQQPTIPYLPATSVGSWGQPCPQHHCWWVWESNESTQADTPGEEHGVCLIAWGVALKQHCKKHKGAHHCVKPNEWASNRVSEHIFLVFTILVLLWHAGRGGFLSEDLRVLWGCGPPWVLTHTHPHSDKCWQGNDATAAEVCAS